jgi:hypothetical protein
VIRVVVRVEVVMFMLLALPLSDHRLEPVRWNRRNLRF